MGGHVLELLRSILQPLGLEASYWPRYHVVATLFEANRSALGIRVLDIKLWHMLDGYGTHLVNLH